MNGSHAGQSIHLARLEHVLETVALYLRANKPTEALLALERAQELAAKMREEV